MSTPHSASLSSGRGAHSLTRLPPAVLHERVRAMEADLEALENSLRAERIDCDEMRLNMTVLEEDHADLTETHALLIERLREATEERDALQASVAMAASDVAHATVERVIAVASERAAIEAAAKAAAKAEAGWFAAVEQMTSDAAAAEAHAMSERAALEKRLQSALDAQAAAEAAAETAKAESAEAVAGLEESLATVETMGQQRAAAKAEVAEAVAEAAALTTAATAETEAAEARAREAEATEWVEAARAEAAGAKAVPVATGLGAAAAALVTAVAA